MGLLQDAILKIESWMSSNRLKLNQNKTQYIWIGTQFQLAKINKQQLARMFPGVDFLDSVVDLGVVIDEELRMDWHIGKLSQSFFYQLRQLRTVRQSLSDTAAKMLMNAFVVTRIDYCNIVLTGASASNIQRIQRIMNAAARLLLRLPKFSHISAVMTGQLHWLPAHRRIQFKLLLMVASCIAGRAPSYIREQCTMVSQFRYASIFILQTSSSSLYQDVTVLQHRNAVFQRPAHRRGIVYLWHCVRLPSNFHVDHSRRIWRHIYFLK